MKKMIRKIKEIWQSPLRSTLIIAIGIALILGYIIRGGGTNHPIQPSSHDHSDESAVSENQIWTCSMHPQIRQPKPGKCPICFMDLVKVESNSQEELTARQIQLSGAAIKLAEIQTAPVERNLVTNEIRMVGKVEWDETRIGYITSRVPGRLDRLYVDYTGVSVKKGGHLVSLYSPQLISAQQELLQALKSYKTFNSGKEVLQAVREKLKLWGLTHNQIKEIEAKGKTTDHLTLYSPLSGVVIHKNAVEGLYVETGARIYTIADLSHLWIKLDAYESDLAWLRYGQTVEFQSEAWSGEIFKGKISFIDPVLNPQTRTLQVRVNVANPQFKLKPQMFVRAIVHSKLTRSGKVINPELAGKWISPMHPEIVKDHPGKCDICGMPLVKAEQLGYQSPEEVDQEEPLIIPASAPLITGTRAVIYVAVKGKKGVFEGREIELGPKTANGYIVKQGVEEGELVVVNGAFKIDADLQIQAKYSMMNPPQEEPESRSHSLPSQEIHINEVKNGIPETFKQAFDEIAEMYFAIQDALSSDDLKDAKKAGRLLKEKCSAIDMKLLKGNNHIEWMKLSKTIKAAGIEISQSRDLNTARQHFERLNGAITAGVKHFGSQKTPVFQFHCPMAFDNKGAYWLQKDDDTRNPYFGAMMLKCNDSIEPVIPASRKKQ